MDKIKIIFGLIAGAVVAIFSIIVFFSPTKDMIATSRNATSVANYPKLGSLMDFSILGILVLAVCVVAWMVWKRRKTG